MANDYTQDLPPELAAQQMQIERRRQLAQAMLAQSQKQQPIQHWTQGLAQLANAYLGKQGLDKADAAQTSLGQQYNQGQAAELDKVKSAMAPQPAITLPDDQAGPTRPEIPASQDKVRAALIQAQMSNYPQVRQFGAGQQKFVEADQAREDQNKAKMLEIQQRGADRATQIQLAAEQGRISKQEADARLAEMKRQHDEMMQVMGGQNYGTFLPTAEGGYQFGWQKGPKAGQVTPPVGPQGRLTPISQDPTTQKAVAEAKAAGKVVGQSAEASQIALPTAVQNAENSTKLVDDLIAHPGFNKAVGVSSLSPMQYIPGTDAKDFTIRLNQLKNKQFLDVYQSLRGAGAITDAEGKKATAAVSRMDPQGSQAAFKQAADEYKQIIQQGVQRLKEKAQMTSSNAAPQQKQPSVSNW